jgi:hypothetical protein
MPTHVSQTKTKTSWSLASLALTDIHTDFILSRQAMNCTHDTMSIYRFTVGNFLEWIEGQEHGDRCDYLAGALHLAALFVSSNG